MSNFFGYYINVQLNHVTIEHILNFFQPIIPSKIQHTNSVHQTCIDIIKQIGKHNFDVCVDDWDKNEYLSIWTTLKTELNTMSEREIELCDIRFVIGYQTGKHNTLKHINLLYSRFKESIRKLRGRSIRFSYIDKLELGLHTTSLLDYDDIYIDYEKIYDVGFDGVLHENVIYVVHSGYDEDGDIFANMVSNKLKLTPTQIEEIVTYEYDIEDIKSNDENENMLLTDVCSLYNKLRNIKFEGTITSYARHADDVTETPKYKVTGSVRKVLKRFIRDSCRKVVTLDHSQSDSIESEYMVVKDMKEFDNMICKHMNKCEKGGSFRWSWSGLDFDDWDSPSIDRTMNDVYLHITIIVKTTINNEPKILCFSPNEETWAIIFHNLEQLDA
jgi:hypothetical protein